MLQSSWKQLPYYLVVGKFQETWRQSVSRQKPSAYNPKTAEVRALEKKIKELETANDILKKVLVFFRRELNEVAARELFKSIRDQKLKEPTKYSVKKIFKILKVRDAYYYKLPSLQDRPYKYDELLASIRQIRANNRDYGANRIYLELEIFHGYTGAITYSLSFLMHRSQEKVPS